MSKGWLASLALFFIVKTKPVISQAFFTKKKKLRKKEQEELGTWKGKNGQKLFVTFFDARNNDRTKVMQQLRVC